MSHTVSTSASTSVSSFLPREGTDLDDVCAARHACPVDGVVSGQAQAQVKAQAQAQVKAQAQAQVKARYPLGDGVVSELLGT